MKRLIILLFCILLPCAALAESTTCPLFWQYEALYGQCVTCYAKLYNSDLDIKTSSGILTSLPEGGYRIRLDGGKATLNSAYSIKELEMTFFEPTPFTSIWYEIVPALSVLEFSKRYETRNNISQTDIINDSMQMLNDLYDIILDQELIQQVTESGEDIFLMSGNYDYYLRYIEDDLLNVYGAYSIVAKARP